MKYKVNLNNKVYEVVVEDGQAMLIDEYEIKAPKAPAPKAPPAAAPAAAPPAAPAPAAAPAAAAVDGCKITSPLPGNILDVKVTQGQAVKAGDLLLIIEAMKMENEVLAPQDGTVKQIATNKGAVVATGDLLLVI